MTTRAPVVPIMSNDPYGPFGALSITKVNAKMVHLWFHDMGVPICFQCPIICLRFGQNKRAMYATKIKDLLKYPH